MKKDILIFNQNMVMGGVEKVTINLLENLNKEKFDVKLILNEKYGELIGDIPKDLQVFYLLDKSYSRNKKGIFKIIGYLKELIIINKNLKKIISKNSVLLNMNIRSIRANISLLRYKNKKIGWFHTTVLADKGTLIERINYKFFYQYSLIFNVSKEGKNHFDSKFPRLKKISKVLYNSFDIQKIIKKGDEEKIVEKNYLLSIGRLTSQKGYDVLIEAMALLKVEGIEEKLYILGDGIERKNLETQIKKLGLENHIFLLGFKDNPYIWLKNTKLYILSSRNEGFGLVLVEALIYQKAIVSTNCICGPNEILENGKYGELVKTEDADSLKEGIKKLLLDNKLRENYEKKSLEKAYDFSNEKVLKKLEKELLKMG